MTANGRHKLEDLKADGMLFVFQNFIHLAVFVQKQQKPEDLPAIRNIVLNRFGSSHRLYLLLSICMNSLMKTLLLT